MKKGILLLSAILALGSLSSSAQKRTATMTDEEMYLDAMLITSLPKRFSVM